jgi:DNA-binding NtrC family response regulator
MSHILPVVAVGKTEVGGQNPQPPPETAAIEVLYVPGGENSVLRRLRDEVEVQVISRALQHTGWNRKRAAALLKISYRGLLYKIRRHSITPTTGK